MEARAVARYVRIPPRKARIVIDLIRGKEVNEALALLRSIPRKGSRIIEKTLRSAIANAEHNHGMVRGDLYVSKAYVDQGPTLKRWHARQRGMAFPILKRMSHITVVVSNRGERRQWAKK